MKDYQQKRMKSYTLPQSVYRQALWAVKDLDRMIKKLDYLEDKASYVKAINMESVNTSAGGMIIGDNTGNTATNIASLRARIEAIEEAFNNIPEVYEKGIRNKLVFDIPYDSDYCEKTWKKWQQILIYHVAMNLGIY